jgi:hypothetical protein
MSTILEKIHGMLRHKKLQHAIIGSHRKYQVCVVLGILIHARIGAYVYLDSIMDASMDILTEQTCANNPIRKL